MENEKSNNWFKNHSAEICLGVIAAIGGATLLCLRAISKNNTNTIECDDLEEPDYGRDCTMKFIVDETGEELGEAKCYESFARDLINNQ